MSKKLRQSKSAQVQALIGIILVLLSGYMVFTFLISTSQIVSSNSEDMACRTVVQTKDTSAFKIYDFFNKMSLNCKTEVKEIGGKKEDEVLKGVADTMNKCWYRYGEGETDFLGNFNAEGNWCFTCAKLSFEDDENTYSYTEDFIPWIKSNYITAKNGSKLTYYDYMNLKYFDGDSESLKEISQGIVEIESMVGDTDSSMKPMIFEMSKKNLELFDLANKQIDTSEEMYVVYRYDRISNSQMEMLATVAGGVLTGMAIEQIAMMGAGVVLAPFTGGASLLLTGKALLSAGKKVKKVVETTTSIKKMKEVMVLMSKATKFTKARVAVKAIGGAVAGTVVANYDSAANQYIDLMTKEQYYRNCGTEPIIEK